MSQKVCLRDFVKENYPLIASMGVTGALTALFTRFENTEVLVVISFLMFVLLDLELWLAFQKVKDASLNLEIFEMLTMILLINIGVYLLQTYGLYVVGVLISLSIIFITSIIGATKAFYRKFQRFLDAHRVLKYTILMILTVFFGFVIAFLLDYIFR